VNEKLPDIVIRTDIPPMEFITRIERLGVGYRTERHSTWDDSKGDYCLDIVPPFDSPHEGLFGQLICSPHWGASARAEVRATRWAGAHPPSYATYVAAAKRLFRPLLTAYRDRFQSRCHMRIESQAALRPRLPQRTAYFFDQFTSAANKQALHPLDWKRFYHFIHAAHVGRAHVVPDDLIRLLVERQFTVEEATELTRIYEHGRALLQHRIMPGYLYPKSAS
jgi:hypothetical protein